MPAPRFTHLFLVTLSVACLGGLLHAGPPQHGDVKQGRATFKKFCATCHGDRGDARTEAASALDPRPANLRILSKRYGSFPDERLRAVIRGQDQSVQDPAMRAWGAMLITSTNGDEAAANRKLDDVIAFIASIQEK